MSDTDSNIDKYLYIMQKYRNGEFGNKNLSLYEILEKANEPNLIDNMTVSELRQLCRISTGVTKYLFNKKINKITKRGL